MHDRREKWEAYLFILPSALIIGTFAVFPVLRALQLSGFRWDMINPIHTFVGWGNYREVLHDPLFWRALGNTAYFAAGAVLLTATLGLGLALLLNLPLRGRRVLRSIYFLPFVVTSVAAVMSWRFVLNDRYGLLNGLLHALHLPEPRWLLLPSLVIPVLIMMAVWKSLGYAAVVYLAGLQSIDPQLYEAARLDGAHGWSLLRHITLPQLMPTTAFVVITSVIAAFQVFTEVFVLYGSDAGPGGAGMTAVFYIYEHAFVRYNLGYAAAAANILFVVILLLTVLQFRLARRSAAH